MSMNDPLGDMLTRIRNAQMRRKGKVQTPGSRLRAHVLDVLTQEGYIRGYSTTEYGNGRTEFEIELKYYDGQPVISEIRARLEARPPRLCGGRRDAASRQRPRHHHSVDVEGRHGRPCRARSQCGRRSALQSLLIGRMRNYLMSRVGKKPVVHARRRHRQGRGPDDRHQGRQGRIALRRPRPKSASLSPIIRSRSTRVTRPSARARFGARPGRR